MMNVNGLQPAWSDVFKPMRDAGRAKHNLTSRRLDDCLTNVEASVPRNDDEGFVVWVNMQSWAGTNLVSAIREHCYAATKRFSHNTSAPW